MGDVVNFNGMTTLDINASEVLNEIAKENPDYVFVIQWNKDGGSSYHSNTADGAEVMMRVQEFVHKYFNGDFI